MQENPKKLLSPDISLLFLCCPLCPRSSKEVDLALLHLEFVLLLLFFAIVFVLTISTLSTD